MYSSHLIAPKIVIRGENAWEESLNVIPKISKKPLFIGKSKGTKNIRLSLKKDLIEIGLDIESVELTFGCCEIDLTKACEIASENNSDSIITSGGGKILDAGKLIADRLNIPCITIPLSAATCAGWTALSNIYSCRGAFIKDKTLRSTPELLIFDHKLIQKAPKRTLSSGIADALAKWYEASLTSGKSGDGLSQQAVQMARVLRDQLFIDGEEAYQGTKKHSWIRVAEGSALTAGLIGGIGGAKCRTAAAHAIHNGLTQISGSNNNLHGEIVGFGILVQLTLEELITKNKLVKQSKEQLISFMKKIELPTNFKDLGLNNISLEELREVCEFACRSESEIHNLPFNVNSTDLLESLLKEGKRNKEIIQKTI